MGQGDRPPDHLVRLAGVHAQAYGQLDGLVELRLREGHEGVEGLGRRVVAVPIHLLGGLRVTLAPLHGATSTPMLRAVPAMIFMACSTSVALRSTIFCSAI